MADQGSIANLKQNINENIVQNTTKEITGTKMNTVLNNIVDTLNFNGRDFFNVNEYREKSDEYANAAAGRAAVPDEVKKLGLVITYLLADGWYIEQYVGTNTTGWGTASNWKTYGPITITQNNESGGWDIRLGNKIFGVVSQNELRFQKTYSIPESGLNPENNAFAFPLKQGDEIRFTFIGDETKISQILRLYYCDANGETRTVLKENLTINREYTIIAPTDIEYLTVYIPGADVSEATSVVFNADGWLLTYIKNINDKTTQDIYGIKKCTYTINDKNSRIKILNGYFVNETGAFVSNSGFEGYVFSCSHLAKINCRVGHVDNVPSAIAFFGNEEPGQDSFMSSYSIDAKQRIVRYNVIDIPVGAKSVVITNRIASLPTSDVDISVYYNNISRNLANIQRNRNDIGVWDIANKLERGNITISQNGWTYESSNYRVCTKEGVTIHLFPGTVIGMKSWGNLQMYVGWRRNNGSYGTSNGWLSSNYTVIEEGDYVLNFQTLSSIDPIVQNLYILSDSLGNYVESIKLDTTYLKESVIKSISNDVGLCNKGDKFHRGNIVIENTGWTYESSTTRVCTKEGVTIHLYPGTVIGLKNWGSRRMYIGWRRADGSYGKAGWLTANYTIAEEGDYVLNFDYAYDAQTIIDELYLLPNSLGEAVFNLQQSLKGVVGVGSHKYYGDNSLNFDIKKKELFCSTDVYISETFGTGNIHRLAQSMAIFNNRIFVFMDNYASINPDNQAVAIYDYTTKELIYTASIESETSHNNNAQFTDVYYNSNDEYPLLMLSRGDYPDGNSDFYFMRIVEENNEFTFTIVKTVHCTLPNAAYNGSWVANFNQKRLFLYTMTIGDWQTVQGNALCLFEFALPDLTNYNDVTLTANDVVRFTKFSYMILQGATEWGGKLYLPVEQLTEVNGVPGSFTQENVIVINPDNGRIENVLPIPVNMEAEGICVYNGKLYVNSKNGNSSQEPDATMFVITEFTFDN